MKQLAEILLGVAVLAFAVLGGALAHARHDTPGAWLAILCFAGALKALQWRDAIVIAQERGRALAANRVGGEGGE